MNNTLKIYGFPLSGHSHRATLFASLAGLAHEVIHVDLANGEHKTEFFLQLNSNAQVPVLVDGGDADALILNSDAHLIVPPMQPEHHPRGISASPSTCAKFWDVRTEALPRLIWMRNAAMANSCAPITA